jgi:ATP-binding cassette subfamily C protein
MPLKNVSGLSVFILFIRVLVRYNWRQTGAAIVLMTFLGLTQGVGLVMIIPFLSLIGLSAAVGAGSGLLSFVNHFSARLEITPGLPSILALFLIILIFYSLVEHFKAVLNMQIERGFIRFLRNRLYHSLLHANWLFSLRNKMSDTATIITSEMERIGIGTQHFLTLVSTVIIALVHIILALLLSVSLTLISMSISIILIVLLWSKNKKIATIGKSIQHLMQSLYASVIEHMGGMKLAKSYTAEKKHAQKFQEINARIENEYIRFTQIWSKSRMLLHIGTGIAMSFFIYIALTYMQMSSVELLLLILIFARLLPRCIIMQQSFQQVLNMLPAFTAVINLQEEADKEQEEDSPESSEQIILRESLEFKNVSFKYDKKLILKDISLCIAARKTSALIGRSGAGKSTVADLLIGLLHPDNGMILIDGERITGSRLMLWRKSVAYIPQDTFFYNDTIRNNLLWARQDASEEELWHVLEMAAAKEFVLDLPHQLDSNIGDRGNRVSGGEGQRIALARALLRKPSLLLLDEATSSLDSESEQRIQEALEKLKGELTIVIIAHRLSTIRNADQIFMIENGCVKDSGSYADVSTTIKTGDME